MRGAQVHPEEHGLPRDEAADEELEAQRQEVQHVVDALAAARRGPRQARVALRRCAAQGHLSVEATDRFGRGLCGGQRRRANAGWPGCLSVPRRRLLAWPPRPFISGLDDVFKPFAHACHVRWVGLSRFVALSRVGAPPCAARGGSRRSHCRSRGCNARQRPRRCAGRREWRRGAPVASARLAGGSCAAASCKASCPPCPASAQAREG
mmetsp:Transcript_109799/g.354487  ORF Transcript_109799/g.354487 Transcript_109799/m.354487 type:complete len:208 (+) Transcript_109799:532-1155(+)